MGAPTLPNPILKANILSRISFWWLNRLLCQGYKRSLELEDIYEVPPNDRSEVLGRDLEILWEQQLLKCKKSNMSARSQNKAKPSLCKVVIRKFYKDYCLLGVVGFIEECILRIAQPLFLGYLIRYFSRPGEYSELAGYVFAGGVVLCSLALTTTHHIYFFGLTHIGMQVRVAVASLIFRKALRLSQAALGDITVGQFVNLLSNDVRRFEIATVHCHHFWIGPTQTVIVMVILWQYLGISCLAGLLALLLLMPFQGFMGNLFSKLRAQTALKTDIRIRLMNEVINGIRVIKLYAWEKPFSKTIADARQNEIKIIRKSATLKAINTSLAYASSKVIIFFSLLTYVQTNNALTAEKVFVALALYNNIRFNMTWLFPNAIASVSEALVSIKRIESILVMDEKEKDIGGYNDGTMTELKEEDKTVTLDHVTAKWSMDYEDKESTLNDVSFSVGAGRLMAIIGHVGSGKGSIIQAILRELPVASGSVKTVGRIAYAAQEPWIFAGSIQDNILFGKDYQSEWYEKVVDACALRRDFSLLQFGDRTQVGDRGSSLSGGQKARINLARAVYANADIYLLDDPLSAVDPEVGRHLFERCINGILDKKIRILVTHQLQFLKPVDHILLIENGKVQMEGTFQELTNSGIDYTKLMSTSRDISQAGSPRRISSISFHPTSPKNPKLNTRSDLSVNSSGFIIPRQEQLAIGENSLFGQMYPHEEILTLKEDTVKSQVSVSIGDGADASQQLPIPEETNLSGKLGISLYFRYFRAGNHWWSLGVLVFANILAQVFFTAADYWLNVWTKAEEQRENNELPHNENPILDKIETDRDFQVAFYSALVAAVFVTSIWRTVLFFRIALSSSISLHNSMFKGIIRAPMRFFEVNPSGRILNRFSSAMGEVDDLLPSSFFDAIGILLNMFATVVLIGVVNPFLLIPAAVLTILMCILRNFYLHTARSVKRIENSTRSPVFSHLSTALYGLSTIRAFRAETQFIKQFDEHLNIHSAAWFLVITSTRWFGYWLDWISTSFIAAVTFSFLIGKGDGPTVGLIVSSVIQLSGMFQWGIRQSAECENQMISVERVMEYTEIKSEAPLESEPSKKPPPDWPSKGEIKMIDVGLHYGDQLPVLQNITCEFRPSEKVGIIGRTGAGKSSLITALFRFAEPTGEILIDGISILSLGLHDLREKLSIIPQDPVLFMGTLRQNLDPFEKYKDVEIWDVLKKVNLAADIKLTPDGIDLEVSEGGANFSVGQRQLVCLARAILKQSKILIMDEATANVDPETDALIQKTLRTIFLNCTVLTVAHRLNTVMDSDRILVLDAGRIEEFDEPYTLLQDTTSELHHLVQETGRDSAQNLYAIAKAAMEKRHGRKESTEQTQEG